MVPKSNTTEYHQNIAWKSELRSVYNLGWDQMQATINNWNNFYRMESTNFYDTLPVNGTYNNPFGAMYWQWAKSWVTQSNTGVDSLAQVFPDQYIGYYEISYFKTDYFNVNANATNVAVFANVNLYNDETIDFLNYEHLFLTFDIYSKNVKSDPPSNSLFNMDNMKCLIELGMSTPNILTTDVNMIYGLDFTLSSEWMTLTGKLNLDSPQQTYFIWLWLSTAHSQVFNRIQDGGNEQTGLMGSIGAKANNDAFTTMKIEFPLLLIASSFNNTYWNNVTTNGQDCYYFYTNVFNFGETGANNLCSDPTNTFNWVKGPGDEGYLKTSLALLTVYFYGANFNIANAGYY